MIPPTEYKKIAQKYDLDLLIVFGSQANNTKNHLSDLDLAFFRLKSFSPEEENNLAEDLMYLHKRADIDIINIKNNPNALLRYQIFMEGKPLYEKKKELFKKMRWQAYIDFEDFKRFYKEKEKLLDKKIQNL